MLTTDSLAAIAERAIEAGRTRLPVCDPEDGLDSPVGVVNAKDLLPLLVNGKDPFELTSIVRPIAQIVDCHGWKAEILSVEETRITRLAVYKGAEPQAD